MKRIILAAMALAMMALGQPAFAQKAKFGELFPSIVRVGVIHDEGLALGSGVVVSRDAQGSFVITNYHVVEGAGVNRIRVLAPKIGTTSANGAPEVEEVTATYWGGDPSADLAILYVRNFFRDPLVLATGATPEDMAVRAIGYPAINDVQWRRLNRTPALRDGIVSTTATAPWSPGRPAIGQIQHTADLEKGMSGGPLVDLCGRVVGMNTAYNAGANSSYLALGIADVIPYLNKSNLAFTQVSTPCDPGARPADETPKPVVKQPSEAEIAARLKAEQDERNRRNLTVFAAVAAGLILLAALGLVVWRLTRGKITPPPPAGPPHGVILRGINGAVGFSLIFRPEDIAVDGGALIGRSANFGSPGTGRQHARLNWSADKGYSLLDNGSLNGTRVNGVEIKGLGERPVKIGDVIEFGARDARYTLEKL